MSLLPIILVGFVILSPALTGDCQTQSGESGVCMKEKDCEGVVKRRYFPTICQLPNSRKAGICCKVDMSTSTTTRSTATTRAAEPTTASHLRCGQISFTTTTSESNKPKIAPFAAFKETREIVAGEITAHGSQPWIAALGSVRDDDSVEFVCGGSLVSSNYVLTSAHCVPALGRKAVVLVGQEDLSINPSKAGGEERRVSRLILHPNYTRLSSSPRKLSSDLALLELDQPVTISDSIMPICLPPAFSDTDLIQPRSNIPRIGIVSGWGRLYSGGPTSPQLQSASVEILAQEECHTKYPDVVDNDTVLCATGESKTDPRSRSNMVPDSCQGDSGGPLILEDDISGLWTLLGVVTGGVGCGDSKYPGLYVNVKYHTQWIKSIIFRS